MSVRNRLFRGMILGLAAVVGLSACSTVSNVFQTKKVDYKSQSEQQRPATLEVPPDLTPIQGDERYAIPGREKGTTYSQYSKDQGKSPEPGTTGVLPSLGDNVQIMHDGAQRWLVVKATPEQVWPVLKEFWTSNGFTLKLDDPQIGVMETDWNENRANIPDDIIRRTLGKLLDFAYSTSLRDKYRTRIERGTVAGTTEIYITHKGMEEMLNKDASSTMWQPRPSDPELENTFLKRLAVRFGVKEAKADTLVSQSAQAIKTFDLATMAKRPDGSPVLQLTEPFDRAWRRVGLALDRTGFTVEDRDRANGVYYVRYTDADAKLNKDKQSFWNKLEFWKSEDHSKDTQSLRITVATPSSGKGTEVDVRDKAEQPINPDSANRILNLLYDQLR